MPPNIKIHKLVEFGANFTQCAGSHCAILRSDGTKEKKVTKGAQLTGFRCKQETTEYESNFSARNNTMHTINNIMYTTYISIQQCSDNCQLYAPDLTRLA